MFREDIPERRGGMGKKEKLLAEAGISLAKKKKHGGGGFLLHKKGRSSKRLG